MIMKNTNEAKNDQFTNQDDQENVNLKNVGESKEDNMEKAIDMKEALFELQKRLETENHENGNHNDEWLLARLGDIVNRYEIIMQVTPVAKLTADELMILGESICGFDMTPRAVSNLHETLMDCSTGDEKERLALRSKIMKLSAAERIALIESLDL